ncbi:MAG: response regulator transcription factor [Bacteroidetes bacterium]|nr:response regulator transcription factor [Bacteroidota bacterium]
MLRAIIIDDESIGIKTLKVLIEKYTTGIKVVATSTDAYEGLSLIEDYRPDIVFLDISMPKMTGFELLEKLLFREFSLVFTTAHEEYALKAIKNKANDYLLKPIDIEELQNCVSNIVSKNSTNSVPADLEPKNIAISVKDGTIFIKPNEVIRLQAWGSYTTFHLENNVKHIASKSLKECESLLSDRIFYRCHNSHIVNLTKVVKLVSNEGLYAQMTDDSKPEVARKNKEVFLEKLKNI